MYSVKLSAVYARSLGPEGRSGWRRTFRVDPRASAAKKLSGGQTPAWSCILLCPREDRRQAPP